MHDAVKLTQSQLPSFLMHVATSAGARRPVFIWGAPGIGKSAIVEQFATELGFECVSLLGSQLAPEDLIGVPQIVDGRSRFCPPSHIARDEPYVLFLDELNACSHDVQKAFYSLIHDRRLGEYQLHPDSVVVGAGNRAQDSAIVRPMSSALINRMVHCHLTVSHRDWLRWAKANGIHHLVIDYLQTRPEHLWSKPPKHEVPFSTPRSWHMLSDALLAYSQEELDVQTVETVAFGALSPEHARRFRSFFKGLTSPHRLAKIIAGEQDWPRAPEDRDLLYDLALSFRSQLVKALPASSRHRVSGEAQQLRHNAKGLIKKLCEISPEYAQMVVAEDDDGHGLPDWFLAEVVRDVPRLAEVEKR